MKKGRRKFTKEFKEEAVKLITEQGYQISEAARNDLSPTRQHKTSLRLKAWR